MYRNDGPRLAAIIDWELATIGDPLIDLGLIIAFRRQCDEGEASPSLDTFASADELVERYAQQSDRDVSAASWYGVLACYKTGIILEGMHARSTWEAGIHWYQRRAHVAAHLLGDTAELRRELAHELADDEPTYH